MYQPIAINVCFADAAMRPTLADGRVVPVPLERRPRLRDASPRQRAHWRLTGRGEGIHWRDVDEDVSVRGLLGLSS